MPRGRPKLRNLNNIENNMQKTLDNNNSLKNTDSNDVLDKSDLSTKSSFSADLSQKNISDIIIKSNEDDKYTIDPITGDKYLKPQGELKSLAQRRYRIPYFTREGFEITWIVNRPNEIQAALDKGWEFVDPKTPGCENAGKKPFAGTNQLGESLYHRAMQMPKERYIKMMAKEGEENDRKERENIYNPALKEGKDFYLKKDHQGNVITRGAYAADGSPINSSGMDNNLATAYGKAMK